MRTRALYREKVKAAALPSILKARFGDFKNLREARESFGDFSLRVKRAVSSSPQRVRIATSPSVPTLQRAWATSLGRCRPRTGSTAGTNVSAYVAGATLDDEPRLLEIIG